ncbi:hypothetical protein B5807_02622 [Epicoccum nigrum]|jgi:hypothetical protein|uniref:Uncharacterized protein n=1 Tax=Epicoccum nigrum TaxID=105696 RepID=A0A1Y2M985_EPING|nr:hypothetical protein B5807_02622 [Epicoccum nigrum]
MFTRVGGLAKETTKLSIVWANYIHVLERLQTIVEFFGGAEIWNWLPDEEWTLCCRRGNNTQLHYVLDKLNTPHRRADQMKRLGPQQVCILEILMSQSKLWRYVPECCIL